MFEFNPGTQALSLTLEHRCLSWNTGIEFNPGTQVFEFNPGTQAWSLTLEHRR